MSEDFTRALARVAVGQLAENAGYESVQESAVDVLSELMIKYITELSTTAHGYAELANRTSINIHDLLLGLDDVGTSVPELHAYLSSLTPVSQDVVGVSNCDQRVEMHSTSMHQMFLRRVHDCLPQ